jgi:SAM-dependent methyltransferase
MPGDHFDESRASRYDELLADQFDESVVGPAVDVLASLAPGGSALEFGIGTGRIALPLSERGVTVHGVDLSAAMAARLRAKPGGHRIPVTIGDFATTRVGDGFDLVYLVFNTIENLTTQGEQVECFANAAAHLRPGGSFVIEVETPQLQRLPPGERIRPFTVEAGRLGFDEFSIATQGLVSHHYVIEDGRAESFSIPFRYVWPSELDLMARLAGMAFDERWGGWDRSPFTNDSTQHISVWKKAPSLG